MAGAAVMLKTLHMALDVYTEWRFSERPHEALEIRVRDEFVDRARRWHLLTRIQQAFNVQFNRSSVQSPRLKFTRASATGQCCCTLALKWITPDVLAAPWWKVL
jgi:hypothetical protein